jgi:hypothetical protein
MSQIVTRPSISEIDMICMSSAANAGWSAGMIVRTGQCATTGEAPPINIEGGHAPKLRSAAQVAQALGSVRAAAATATTVTRARNGFMKAVTQSGARVLEPQRLEVMTAQLRNARTPQALAAAMEVVEREVVRQHGQLFMEQLAVHVMDASREIGFSEVYLRKGPVLTITALDANGAGLPSTLHLNARTGEVELRTETIGLPDGQCDQVMERLELALRKRGVSSPVRHVKYSGRACEKSDAARSVAQPSPKTKLRS